MDSFVIFTPTAPASENTRWASFPLTIVADAPAPSISSFFATSSWAEVSLIVPAGTMIVEPGVAVAIALRSGPGPESAMLVTWIVAASAPRAAAARAAAHIPSAKTPRRAVDDRSERIRRGTPATDPAVPRAAKPSPPLPAGGRRDG